MENEISPLKKYQRTPKLFIDLPSKGNYYPKGVLDKVEELEVYSMTASDELMVRTPDALFTGQAVKNVIEHCVPAIKNALLIPTLDVDYILAAIRMASYGDTINMSATCPACSENSDYGIEVQRVMDHFDNRSFLNETRIEDFLFRIRPFTYKELTEIQKKTILLQRQIVQKTPGPEDDQNETELGEIYTTINQIATDAVCAMVTEIVTPDGETENNPIFIRDFIINNDKVFYNGLKELQEQNVNSWKLPDVEVSCGSCENKFSVATTLDYSNFFVRG